MNQQTPDPDYDRPITLFTQPLNGLVMVHEKSGRLYQVVIQGTGTEDNEEYIVYIPANYLLLAFIRFLAVLLLLTKTPVWVRTKDDFTGLNSRGLQRFFVKK